MSGSDTSAPNGTVREESFRTGAERGELQEAEAVAIILTLYRRHSNNQKSQLPSKRKAKRVLEEQLPHFRVNGSTLGKLVAKAQNLLEGERCLERQNKLAEKKRLIECRRRVESQLAHGAASDSEGGSAQCLRAISLAGDTSLRCCDETSGQMVTSSAVHGGSPTSSTHGIAFLHFDPEKYPEILQRRSSTLISRFRNLRVGFHSSSHSATSEATGRCVMDESTEVKVFASEPTHYRMRVGLGVFDDDEAQYHRHLPPPLPAHEVSAGAVVDGLRYVYWQAQDEACSNDDCLQGEGNNPTRAASSAAPAVKKTDGRSRKMVNVGHSFPIASRLICRLMPVLLQGIGRVFAKTLRAGLRCVRFLSTLSGDCVIALVYRQRGLQGSWATDAAKMLEWLNSALKQNTELQPASAPSKTNLGSVVGVVGHSKGVKHVVGQDYVIERGLYRPDVSKTQLLYRQAEASFSNPNASVCQATINWLYATMQKVKLFVATSLPEHEQQPFSLMELYCGNANHSVALAPIFDRIFGVEINPRLVEAARENLRVNKIDNVVVLEADCHAFSKCMEQPDSRNGNLGGGSNAKNKTLAVECTVGRALGAKQSSTKRKRCKYGVAETAMDHVLQDHVQKQPAQASVNKTQQGQASKPQPECIAATIVLVDPPRAGLDPRTRAFVQRFPFAVYISCNPESLLRDLGELGQSHRVASFCFLDHFPYTEHTECAVLLARRNLDFQPS